MADVKVLQPSDLNSATFSNNGSAGQGGIDLRLSGEAGNLLSHREDGLYYGTVAPADVRTQFVDYVNGNDNNPGTREAPLKTFARAVWRLPQGSLDNYIFLAEGQTHVVDNVIDFTSSVYVFGYGPNTDSIEALWNSSNTGWTSTAAKEYEPYRPTLQFNYHFTSPNMGGFSAMSIHLRGGSSLYFRGIDFKVPNPIVPVSKQIPWLGIMWGDGLIELQECKIYNGNASVNTWFFADSHDSQLVVYLRNVDVESTNKNNILFGVHPFLEAKFEDHVDEHSHPSGLTWRGSTPKESLKPLQTGALPPQTVSPNYKTNF